MVAVFYSLCIQIGHIDISDFIRVLKYCCDCRPFVKVDQKKHSLLLTAFKTTFSHGHMQQQKAKAIGPRVIEKLTFHKFARTIRALRGNSSRPSAAS